MLPHQAEASPLYHAHSNQSHASENGVNCGVGLYSSNIKSPKQHCELCTRSVTELKLARIEPLEPSTCTTALLNLLDIFVSTVSRAKWQMPDIEADESKLLFKAPVAVDSFVSHFFLLLLADCQRTFNKCSKLDWRIDPLFLLVGDRTTSPP